jgi:hypothetical protein
MPGWRIRGLTGIFAHLPHFTFFIAYFPYDHHMLVTHGVSNMQSAKKSVANVQIPRCWPLAESRKGQAQECSVGRSKRATNRYFAQNPFFLAVAVDVILADNYGQ